MEGYSFSSSPWYSPCPVRLVVSEMTVLSSAWASSHEFRCIILHARSKQDNPPGVISLPLHLALTLGLDRSKGI